MRLGHHESPVHAAHEPRGLHADIPVPSFAGFNTTHDEQQAMGKRLREAAGMFSSGNAGLASNFMDLGHSKLRDGGVLALVIPFASVRGQVVGTSTAGTAGSLQRRSCHFPCRHRFDGAGILRGHRHGRVPCRGDQA